MFLPLHMIALTVVFRGGSMRLGGVLVVLGSLVMLVSCHGWFLVGLLPAATKAAIGQSFLSLPAKKQKYI